MSNRSLTDEKRRLLTAKYELKRIQYKAVCADLNLASSVRYDALIQLGKLPRNSSKTRIRNRCIVTGRPRAVYKRFQISRIVFRELASKGVIVGVSKSSW